MRSGRSPWLAALPGYLGGKRRLCPLIFATLASFVSPRTWRSLTFLDPFLGGGSVSLTAKSLGFRVRCNDLAFRSAVIGRALIGNSSRRLSAVEVATILRPVNGEYAKPAEEAFCPSTFSQDQARSIDRALCHLREDRYEEPVRSLLYLLLIKWVLKTQPMSMLRGTDARAAAEGDYDRVSPRRVGHYLDSRRLLQPAAWWRLAEEVNLGVFAGDGEAQQSDAFEFLSATPGDVVYLDPPYPRTTSYEKEYAVLDRLLEGHSYAPSAFSSSTPPLDDLFRAARHVPTWLVSLGNAAMTITELTDLISKYHNVERVIEVPYRHLASIASKEKNAENKEHLVLAIQ